MRGTSRKTAIVSAVAALCLFGQHSASADVLYWDSNGTAAGAGGTPTGIWGTSNFWNLDSAGMADTFRVSTASADDLYLVAGPASSSGNSAHTVTVLDTQSANSLTFRRSGATTISGGSGINLTSGISISQYAYGSTNNGAVTISTPLSLQASQSFTNNSSNALTVSGVISDGGNAYALTKSGTGALVLSGANAFSGGTTLNAGTLHVNNASAIGTGKLTINGGTLTYSGATNNTGMTLTTNNVQDWNGDFSYSGKSSTSDPKTNWNLNLGNGAVTLGGNRTVTVSGNSSTNGWSWDAATLTVGGIIGDGGNGYTITKSGAGTLRLNAANTFSGGITLNAGTLQLGNAQALGAGRLTVNGGTISNATGQSLTLANNPHTWNGSLTVSTPSSTSMNLGNGAVTLTNNTTITVVKDVWGARTTVAGNIGDDGKGYGLTVQANGANAGSIQFSGQNTFGGGVTLLSGTLRIDNNNALGTGLFTINGGTIQQNADTTLAGISGIAIGGDFSMSATSGAINLGTAPVTVSGARAVTLDNGNATIGGAISGTTGSLVLKGTQWASTYFLNGASTFGGGLTITPGTSSLTVNLGNLGSGSTNSSVGTGTMRFYSTSTGAALIDNTSGAAGTLATNNAQAWDYNFTFLGTHDLNMGTGAVTLGGNRTVTVSAKVLTIGGAIDDGASSYGLTKAGAGTLVLAGNNTYGGSTTITAGTLTLDTAGSILLDINDGSNTALLGTGTVNLNGTLVLDVADVVEGGNWTIIAPGLTDNYGATFGLALAGSGTAFTSEGSIYSATSGGKSWTFDRSTGALSVVIPEPGTIAGVFAVVGLALSRRRRSH